MEFVDGGHQWLPAELTIRALGWHELLAMKDGLRPLDGALAWETLAGDMARALAA